MGKNQTVSELEETLRKVQQTADESIKEALEKEIYRKAAYIFNSTPECDGLSAIERRIAGVKYHRSDSSSRALILEDIRICYPVENGSLQIFKEVREKTEIGPLTREKTLSKYLVYNGTLNEISCHKRPQSCGEAEMNWHTVLDGEYMRLRKAEADKVRATEITALNQKINSLTQNFS